jgi:membrane protease subunit (stomatin/prohibitin family)
MAVLEIIKFDGTPAPWLVYKWPKDNITVGSQLIVHQSQEAVFFKGGMALDAFGPGAHTLVTANIPLLQKIVNLPFGGQSPFVAEIYFVNKGARLDILWGTGSPIQVLEPKFQIIARVGSHGRMGIRIDDTKTFLGQISGALAKGALEDYSRVESFFKGLVINGVKKVLADAIVNQKTSLFDINAKIDTLSAAMQQTVTDEFKRFGIGVLNFYIESIHVVEDDLKKLRSILEGKAEFEVLGDSRYTRKRTFDTLEKAAENPGSGANIIGTGLGIGAGIGAGAAVAGAASGIFKDALSISAKCPKCEKEISQQSQFCNWCGTKLT